MVIHIELMQIAYHVLDIGIIGMIFYQDVNNYLQGIAIYSDDGQK